MISGFGGCGGDQAEMGCCILNLTGLHQFYIVTGSINTQAVMPGNVKIYAYIFLFYFLFAL